MDLLVVGARGQVDARGGERLVLAGHLGRRARARALIIGWLASHLVCCSARGLQAQQRQAPTTTSSEGSCWSSRMMAPAYERDASMNWQRVSLMLCRSRQARPTSLARFSITAATQPLTGLAADGASSSPSRGPVAGAAPWPAAPGAARGAIVAGRSSPLQLDAIARRPRRPLYLLGDVSTPARRPRCALRFSSWPVERAARPWHQQQ